MTPAEVLDNFAATRRAVERETLPPNLGVLIDEAAARFADRPLWVGVDGDGSTLTYRQFATRVYRCANALARWGIGQGTHVAVILPPVPASAITWLALARLGAVMVPVNPRLTPAEIGAILTASEAEALIAASDTLSALTAGRSTLPVARERTIVFGGALPGFAHRWEDLVDRADAAPPSAHAVDPDQLLSLQYTSGSTGVPKGCMLTHRYWCTIGRVRVSQGPAVQRLLIDMPFHYMGGQWRFIMAMYMGATAFVAGHLSQSRFLERLVAHDIDFCTVTNALAKLPDDPRYPQLKLRWAMIAGLNKDLHADFEARLRTPIREMYGLTETGSVLTVPMEAIHMVGSGSCGLPVAFRTCRILDPDGREVAAGESGELWVAGPAMFRGYFRRPELDAEVRRDGWFRTGDLFRRDRDGYHYMLGRMKDIIRRSGENIAAGEVEAALQRMPEVMEVAAIPVPDALRGEEVKVVVALRDGLTPETVPPQRIVAFCGDHLAKFKLPRYVAYLPQLPKTASAKIDKPALRAAATDLRTQSFDTLDGVWR